jgi:hypothetical protein
MVCRVSRVSSCNIAYLGDAFRPRDSGWPRPSAPSAPLAIRAWPASGLRAFARAGIVVVVAHRPSALCSELEPPNTTGNLIVDGASPFPTYGSAGQNVHGNSAFNVSQPIPAGNTTLTTCPADPAQPVRIAW